MGGKCHVRCVSFPSRSHSSTTAIERELDRFTTLDASSALTSASVHARRSGLDDLYGCVRDLLNVPSTRQLLSRIQNRKHVDDLLDDSLRILVACSIARDLASHTKQHVRSLVSAVRRRKGDSSIQSRVSDYACFRKKMKKEAGRLAASLKQVDNKIIQVAEQDHHLLAIIRALRAANAANASVFQSLLSFLSTAPPSKTRRSVWKLMHKGTVVCAEEEEIVNEVEAVDAALSRYASCVEEADAKNKQKALESLDALEISIEGFESSLECIFRRLINARASLLNIISQ